MMKKTKRLIAKNHAAFAPVASRSFYPDHNKVLTHLMNLKADVKNGDLKDKAVIRAQMISAFRMCENLGDYYDYYDHTCYTEGENIYGARSDLYSIGGLLGRKAVENPDFTASNDNEIHDFNKEIQPGQVLFISDDAVIDLSDFLIAGDTDGYNGVKIPFEFIVKKDTAWVGNRGVGDFGGAILKVTSYSDCTIVVGENARLAGLVIQGPDREVDIKNHDQNFSCGILVRGHNAIVENCEISGFYRMGIHVYYSNNVTIRNNYIHDILSPTSGRAVYLEGSTVEMYGNLFSNVTNVVTNGFKSSLDFHDNMDAGNVRGRYFDLFTAGQDFSIKNNTFLSSVALLSTTNASKLEIENNLFAYPESTYRQTYLTPASAPSYKNNVFDIQNPLVLSKSGDAPIADNTSLGKYSYIVSDKIVAFDIPSVPASLYVFKAKEILPALSACYYSETNDKGYAALRNLIQNDSYALSDFPALITEVIAYIGEYANLLKYSDEGVVSCVIDGQRYGAHSDGDMIGGGFGYSDIFTTGDYIVTNEAELLHAFEVAQPGEVIFLPGDAYINLSDAPTHTNRTVIVPAGVTLASDRGRVREDGSVSTGGIIATSAQIYHNLMYIAGEGVRMTGFVFKGSDPGRHMAHHARTPIVMKDKTGISSYYYRVPNTYGMYCSYSHCEFDNMEVCGFNTVGIGIGKISDPVKNARVHHCYIHHCQELGLGYGVRVDGAFVNVEYNMFNYNRHSIASGGHPTCSYIAENNIEMGESIGHYIDMHGGNDRHDGTFIAGNEIYMRNNSFLGSCRPFYQRGYPVTTQQFFHNVIHGDVQTHGKFMLYYRGEKVEKSIVGKNIWDLQNGNRAPHKGAE